MAQQGHDRLGPQGTATAKKQEIKIKYPVDLATVKTALESAGQTVMSEIERAVWQSAVDVAVQDLGREQPPTQELQNLLQMAQGGHGIAVMDMRLEQEVSERTRALENTLDPAVEGRMVLQAIASHSISERLQKHPEIDFPTYFKGGGTGSERVTKLQQDAAKFKTAMQESRAADPIEAEENQQIQLGLDKARDVLVQQAVEKRVLDPLQVERLSVVLDTGLKSLTTKQEEYRQEILNWIRKPDVVSRDPDLAKMLANPMLYSEQDLLDYVLDAYQIRARTSVPHLDVDAIEGTITLFLVTATEVQQVARARREMGKLKGLLNDSGQVPPTRLDDWNEMSAKIYEILLRGCDTKRYLDENGALKDPELTRKYLVAEYRSEVILRPGQIKTIQDLAQNPQQWVSLRMGLGKTSYIMPILANILVEQGKLPFLVVPTALQQMNFADFDRTTRRFYGRAAEPFIFSGDRSATPGALAETYQRLLEAKTQGRYFVTNVESLASVKNLAVMLADDKVGKLAHYFEMPEGDAKQKLMLDICDIDRRIHWLSKIEALLDGRKASGLAVDTFFFGDEVDFIFSVTKEINRATGQTQPLDSTVCAVSHALFEVCLAPNQQGLSTEEFTALQELQAHLRNGTQAGIPKKTLQEKYLPALAKALLHHKAFSDTLGPVLQAVSEPDLVRFLTGTSHVLPPGLPPYDEDADKWDGERQQYQNPPVRQRQRALAAAKHMLSPAGTLASIFSLEPGVAFGFSDADGATIVPKEAKRETPGNRFGDEYELIALQYLGYVQQSLCRNSTGTSTEFVKTAVARLQERDPEIYRKLQQETQAVDREDLVKKLLEPERALQRLTLLEDVVIGGRYISKYSEQITLSVQSTVTGRATGGVTGTLTPYALPQYDAGQPGKALREVEAETFLQTAVKAPPGFDTVVESFDEEQAMDLMIRLVNNPKTVAIINEGGYGMRGQTTVEWVKALREKCPKKSFVYVDPVSRKSCLWEKGQASPQEIDIGHTTLPEDRVCLFAPEDCRGTDLDILPGETHYFPIRTANLQEMGQAVWRGRGTGERHVPVLHVPKTLTDGTPTTLLKVIDGVKKKGLERQAPLNLKAQLFRVRETANAAVRSILFSPRQEMDDPEYWAQENKVAVATNLIADSSIFTTYRSYLIKSKGLQFQGDYQPSQDVESVEYVQKAYDDEITRLKDSKMALARAAAKTVTQSPLPLQMPPEYTLARLLFMVFLGYESSHEKPSEDNVAENLIPIIGLYAPQLMQEPLDPKGPFVKLVLRLVQATTTVDQAVQNLEREREAFRQQAGVHAKFLPQKVPQAAAGSGGTQEQVQQQQQQEQQTVPLHKRREQKKTRGQFVTYPLAHLMTVEAGVKNKNLISMDTLVKECGLDDLYVTAETLKLLNLLPTLRGDPIARVAVNARGKVMAISKLDYHRVVEPGWTTCGERFAVYQPTMTGLRPVKSTAEGEPRVSPLKTAQMRLLLGYTHFAEEELAALKHWYQGLASQGTEQIRRYFRDHGMSVAPLRQLAEP